MRFVPVAAVAVGLALAPSADAASSYLPMETAKKNVRSLARKVVVRSDADSYSLGRCYRESSHVVYCRLYLEYYDMECSDLVRVKVTGSDEEYLYTNSKVVDADCG